MDKLAFIKKLPNGKYRVLSQNGKNLGTFDSEKEAKERLKQVEYFKHSKANKKINLTKIDELSLSAVIRELNKQTSEDNVLNFMKIYHKNFNDNVLNQKKNIDKLSLIESLVEFNKTVPVKIDKSLTKSASFNYNKAWNTLSKNIGFI